nr:MAG TPA: hypothetical protein [Caudoviricetes sp.]
MDFIGPCLNFKVSRTVVSSSIYNYIFCRSQFYDVKTDHLTSLPNTEKARPNLWIILGSW